MENMLFMLKKLISSLLYPIGFSLLLCYLGFFLWIVKSRSKKGSILIVLAVLLLTVLSTPLCGTYLLSTLEKRVGTYADPAKLTERGVKIIVVLGGGQYPGVLQPTDRLKAASLKRLLEGIRLWRQIEGSKLILCGGKHDSDVSEAETMAQVALSLGVPKDAMLIEAESLDTEDQARLLVSKLTGQPFALVTSASHLPRAAYIFRRYGLTPILTPADIETHNQKHTYRSLIPCGYGVFLSEKAIHEYLGMGWLRLKSMVQSPPKPGS